MVTKTKLEAELNELVDLTLLAQRLAVINAALDGVRYLLSISPVYTGWYAANHRVALNTNPTDLFPSSRPPDSYRNHPIAPSPDDLALRASEALLKYEFGDAIIMKNTVPYADKLEFGTPTRPEGMFYARAEQFINESIRKSFVALKGSGANAVRKRYRGTARFRTTVTP